MSEMYKKIDLQDRCLVSEEAAKEFIDHRINIKKPLTQRAFKRAMMTASECPQKLGMPVDWAVEKTIDRGWQGIELEFLIPFCDRIQHSGTPPINGCRPTRDIPITEQLADRSWADKH